MPAFLFLVAGASAFAPPPVTQSAKNWNITLQFFDGTLQVPRPNNHTLPPLRRSPAGGASRAALSARQWLAQGFFEPWSPFPHPGKQRCAGDVTGAFFEINKAMNEIGAQTTSEPFITLTPAPTIPTPIPAPAPSMTTPPGPDPDPDPGFDSPPTPTFASKTPTPGTLSKTVRPLNLR